MKSQSPKPSIRKKHEKHTPQCGAPDGYSCDNNCGPSEPGGVASKLPRRLVIRESSICGDKYKLKSAETGEVFTLKQVFDSIKEDKISG